MRFPNFLLIGAFVYWSCGPSLKITTDYDKSVDFSKYKSFAIYNTEGLTDALSQLNHDRVINAVKTEMAKKGFAENTGAPDLMVNINAVLKQKSSVSSTNYYAYGSVYRPYTWGPGVSYTDYDVRHYKDGSLIIDVVDAQAKKLVWQGIGNKEIDKPSKNPDTDIPKAVSSIMVDFPPGVSKTN